jgi:FKBP-type peptidyl-prolyl cis-trans isomerase FkpA
MKLSFPLAAAFAALLSLTACGGGGGDSGSGNAASPTATVTKTDTVVGTGAEAVAGSIVQVNYTGWLFSASAAGNKGAKFDANKPNEPFTFVVGTGTIVGFAEGVKGMKVGGKRTIVIPASLGYGAAGAKDPNTGATVIPPNADLVFDVELLKVCANAACT